MTAAPRREFFLRRTFFFSTGRDASLSSPKASKMSGTAWPLSRVDELPWGLARLAFNVKGQLEDHDRCNLVHHRPVVPRRPARLVECPVGTDTGEPLINQTYRNVTSL